ncbi:DNA oxidative demethylase AlkB [Marinobacter sp. HN1S83]|uniref:DNA oxidative demethylase AlkB n=1 Tax=Marinobacter sp. HN1S83 TaxID=3382301 RepID=UPI00387AACC3
MKKSLSITPDLFAGEFQDPWIDTIADDAVVLRHFALEREETLLAAIAGIAEKASFRNMRTPGGHTMSVAMTCCGEWGWVTDTSGYRYQHSDPGSGQPWPAMPKVFRDLAREAATGAGYPGFEPDACLINRYQPGAKMGLHQDKDEKDFTQPIVSVSLGVPATFQLGGARRRDRPVNTTLTSGDVVVWGRSARMNYHGVLRLKPGQHPLTGELRYNLTFRRAL